jgi:hypothetical protein
MIDEVWLFTTWQEHYEGIATMRRSSHTGTILSPPINQLGPKIVGNVSGWFGLRLIFSQSFVVKDHSVGSDLCLSLNERNAASRCALALSQHSTYLYSRSHVDAFPNGQAQMVPLSQGAPSFPSPCIQLLLNSRLRTMGPGKEF